MGKFIITRYGRKALKLGRVTIDASRWPWQKWRDARGGATATDPDVAAPPPAEAG